MHLSFGCVNVCGLLSKICIPEFKQYVASFDVFSCSESHLDDLDVIELEDFACVLKNRKQTFSKMSGGIATFVKNDIYVYFEEIYTDCEYVQWFKLSKRLFSTNDDVILGSVYIPPDNTRFFKQNILDLFYSGVSEFNNNHDYVILLGDFNARTANLSDTNEIDSALFDFVDIDANSVFETDIFHELNQNGMSYDNFPKISIPIELVEC